MEKIELSKVETLVVESCKALKVDEKQFKVALLTLSKLKNYFSDLPRSYLLGQNHQAALKSILDYIIDKKITTIDQMKDIIYSMKKSYNARHLDDEQIRTISTIKIIERTAGGVELKAITFDN